MNYYTTVEYFDEATGEPVSREEVQQFYNVIKTVTNNVKYTAEATTIKKSAIVRRSAQIKIEFPDYRKGTD